MKLPAFVSGLSPRLLARLGRSRLWRKKLQGAPLFDPEWYLQSHPDLAAAGVDPAWHYLGYGAAEGRDPGPLFSSSGYRLQGWRGVGNPLLHHLSHPGDFLALPKFQGNSPDHSAKTPVVLFVGHQALGQQFGAERSFLHMLDRARQAGLQVDVLLPHCLDAAYLQACRLRARAVYIIPFPWRRGGQAPHPATLHAIEALIRQTGAVEVHQNTLVPEVPLTAARAAGVPCVVYLRELPDQDPELCAWLQMPPEALRASLIRQADRFIANSTATADWILAGSAQDSASALAGRVTVLPNAIDAALFDLPFAPQTPLRVALVGSNTAKKGIADALLVARGCADLGVDVEVVLIGPETADLRALGPLPKNMRLAGYAPDPIAALAQVDVLLSLSHFSESFGRTVLEALAAGRPVIAYDRGTPPALIGSEGAGVVVPADDPQAVVAALQAILRTPTALPGLSNKARQRAREILALAENIPDSALFGPCRDQDC